MKIIIIGAGPAGYETAVEAARRGIETVIVSDGPLGGTCLNEGCIPTKTFCTMQSPDQGKKDSVIGKLSSGISSLLSAKLITLVHGHAVLLDSRTVEVEGVKYGADAIILATGSVSASLPVPGASFAVTSKEMLEMDSVPSRLCVIGGGVIGLEFASIFNRFGSRVSVLEFCPGILPRFDLDLAKRLKAALVQKGIAIETSACVRSITRKEDGTYLVSFEKGEVISEIESDCVLMAVGRRPALDSLNLSDIGIEFGPKGVVVDKNQQTTVSGVYAAGDICGGRMLAHTAVAQGLRALNAICGLEDEIDFDLTPAAVFTDPELATVGMTEEECKAAGIKVRTLKSFYRANGKAVSMDASEGYCKIIIDAESTRILGAHILGAHSSDIIHELAVMMNLGATAKKMRDMIFAHPTVSEVVSSALKTL